MAKNPMFITRQCVVALRHHERYRAYGRRGEPYHFLLSPEKPVGFAPTTEIKLVFCNSISFRDLNAVRQNMTTTPDRVQVPGLNLQQEIGSSIRYTSATCLSHSVATPSRSGT
ncbi:hypothetical protein OUZ56_009397 [Daphnia magna]|uniref:Uncharacterized protein n=1 Tax=Daphnia magna TaxID=35525 RepID=A0ABR0AFW7_9CRUS|nr:hypothetical protein OUZ56_009397 [Daphnia magna]